MKNVRKLLTGFAVAFALCAVVAGSEMREGVINAFAAESGNDNVVKNALQDALNHNPNANVEDVAGIVTSVGGIDALKTELDKSDGDVMTLLGELEEKVKTTSNITVASPVVTNEAGEYLNVSQVYVLGAALNAEANSTVNLAIDVKDTPAEVASSLGSVGATQAVTLDINLSVTSGSATTEVHDLKAPIRIQMPIPAGLGNNIIIFHQLSDGTVEKIYPRVYDRVITFTVKSFSNFVFAQLPETAEQSKEEEDTYGAAMSRLDDMIATASAGSTIEITKEMDIKSLSHDQMQALVKRGDVTLKMQYVYKDQEYSIVIPAGCAENNDIEWYGPLYLAAHYSGNAVPTATAAATGEAYQVQKGDTLSKIAAKFGTTVNILKSLNPQIQDVNKIYTGWKLNVK